MAGEEQTGEGGGAGKGWAVRIAGWLCVAAVVGVIILLGVRQMGVKSDMVKNVPNVGPTDDTAYALMGASISEGRGIHVDYISDFYLPYPRGITHRENHWPPFMGYSIAPMFLVLGRSAYAARLPGIFYGSLGLPLATALLAYALSRRGYAAMVAGLLIMATTALFQHSLRTLSDVPLAMLLAGFCGSVIMARKHPWMHVVAGLCAAGAYYAKGSQILLLGFYPLLTVMLCGWGGLKRKWFWAGMATALALMGPFWYANWRDYGNPFFSTQNYVSSFYGFEEWDTSFRHPYWGKNLPKISDRWRKHEREYWAFSRGQLASVVQYLLVGGAEIPTGEVWNDFGARGVRAEEVMAGDAAPWGVSDRGSGHAAPMRPVSRWISPVWEIATILAAMLLAGAVAILPVFAAIKMWRWWRRRKGKGKDAAADGAMVHEEGGGWRLGAVLGVGLVIVVNGVFLAFFWKVEARFIFPLMPLVLALACTAGVWVLEWPVIGAARLAKWWICRKKPVEKIPAWITKSAAALRWWPAGGTLAMALLVLCFSGRVYGMQRTILERTGLRRNFPYAADDRFQALGQWVGEHLPWAIVMGRKPWDMLFYMSGTNKAVAFPVPADRGRKGAEQFFAIARYYGVTHIFVDETWGFIEPYVSQRLPGLKRVADAPAGFYELDWSVLQKKTVEEVFGP